MEDYVIVDTDGKQFVLQKAQKDCATAPLLKMVAANISPSNSMTFLEHIGEYDKERNVYKFTIRRECDLITRSYLDVYVRHQGDLEHFDDDIIEEITHDKDISTVVLDYVSPGMCELMAYAGTPGNREFETIKEKITDDIVKVT